MLGFNGNMNLTIKWNHKRENHVLFIQTNRNYPKNIAPRWTYALSLLDGEYGESGQQDPLCLDLLI